LPKAASHSHTPPLPGGLALYIIRSIHPPPRKEQVQLSQANQHSQQKPHHLGNKQGQARANIAATSKGMARQQLKVSAAADTASWCLALSLVALLLVCSLGAGGAGAGEAMLPQVRGAALSARPCEEIYVVAECETLHSISDKCGDPYILEQNPHVHDPDDVFPGLVLKITPSKPR